MQLFRHSADLPATCRGGAVALGNFDGVHRGHQAVVEAVQDTARRVGGPAAMLTFEPHPRTLFRPGDPPFRLTPFRAKVRRIEGLGIDVLLVLSFDKALAALDAEAFIADILVRDLGARAVLVGADFRFGRGRAGTVDMLRERGRAAGYEVIVVPPFEDHGYVISSTRIRDLIVAGDVRSAANLLGAPLELDGRVERGDQLGRTLGWPTANILLDPGQLRPAKGVYAVRAGIDAGMETDWWRGVANYGVRPTVDGVRERFEVHLFDVSPDLYGQILRVQLVDHIRAEQRFDGLEALKARIAADARAARAILD